MKWFEKLSFARKVSGLSFRQVEAKTGISNAYLCQLEKGQVEDPSYFKIRKLLQLYNLDHGDFDSEI